MEGWVYQNGNEILKCFWTRSLGFNVLARVPLLVLSCAVWSVPCSFLRLSRWFLRIFFSRFHWRFFIVICCRFNFLLFFFFFVINDGIFREDSLVFFRDKCDSVENRFYQFVFKCGFSNRIVLPEFKCIFEHLITIVNGFLFFFVPFLGACSVEFVLRRCLRRWWWWRSWLCGLLDCIRGSCQ